MTQRGGYWPAFPRPASQVNHLLVDWDVDPGDTGMSLRDWFAGQALAGLATKLPDNARTSSFLHLAEAAYDAADAMLEVRLRGLQ